MRLTRRCKARMEPRPGLPHHGRCDERAGHDGNHVLERGMDRVEWSTEPLVGVWGGIRREAVSGLFRRILEEPAESWECPACLTEWPMRGPVKHFCLPPLRREDA